MGSDASHLHPLLQETLRTGKIPPHEEIARAIGMTTAEVARAVAAAVDSDSDDADNDVDSPSPDDQGLRDKYRQLVATMIDAWYEDNPGEIHGIPVEVRKDIEDHCRRQIQYEARRLSGAN